MTAPRLPHLRRRIARPNGRKSILRLFHDLGILIDRAPVLPDDRKHWIQDADQKMRELRFILERIYSDLPEEKR